VPDSGYMVSLDGHTHTYPASVLNDPSRLAQVLVEFAAAERAVLSQPGMFIGGWVSEGKLWLDPSQNIPVRAAAVKAGKAQGQIAIWDVAGGTELATGGSGGGHITSHS
jgi:hypothetical protein